MNRQDIENFLYRVANDDVYRYQLTTDPINTCAAVGIEVLPSDIPEGGIVLPPGSLIMQHLSKIADDFYALCAHPLSHFIWDSTYINSLES